MNKGFAFCLGLVIGIGGGGFLAHTMLKQTFAQKSDEQISACSEAFRAELAKMRKEREEKESAEKKEKAAEAIQTYSHEPEKGLEMVQKADEKKDDIKEPYEISDEIYDDAANPFTPIGLTYFPAEGILLQPDGSIMQKESIETTVGLKALALFDGEDRDRVCIRNERFQNDYEIILSGITYEEWRKRHPVEKK